MNDEAWLRAELGDRDRKIERLDAEVKILKESLAQAWHANTILKALDEETP